MLNNSSTKVHQIVLNVLRFIGYRICVFHLALLNTHTYNLLWYQTGYTSRVEKLEKLNLSETSWLQELISSDSVIEKF